MTALSSEQLDWLNTHARTPPHTHTRTHAHTHARTHARTHAHTHTHTHMSDGGTGTAVKKKVPLAYTSHKCTDAAFEV